MTAEDKKWDKKWRAESDAGTLIEAEAIQADSKRKKAAIDVANVIAKEAQDRGEPVSMTPQYNQFWFWSTSQES